MAAVDRPGVRSAIDRQHGDDVRRARFLAVSRWGQADGDLVAPAVPHHHRQMMDADALWRTGDAAQEAGDLDLARRCFERGAALDDWLCLGRLASLHDTGLGVPVDKRLALRLYWRAWRKGCVVAAGNIAILYREKDNLRGVVRWFGRAVEAGDDGARIQIAKLAVSGDWPDSSPDLAMRQLHIALAGNLCGMEREEAEALREGLRPRLVAGNDCRPGV